MDAIIEFIRDGSVISESLCFGGIWAVMEDTYIEDIPKTTRIPMKTAIMSAHPELSSFCTETPGVALADASPVSAPPHNWHTPLPASVHS